MPLVRLECGSKKSSILGLMICRHQQNILLCCFVESGAAEGGGRLRRREGVSVSERPSQEPVKGDNMERTPEEIKKGLECCSASQDCTQDNKPKCPYYEKDTCLIELLGDAIALIQQYESGMLVQAGVVATMREQAEKLEAEKAELLRLLKEAAARGGVCVGCKHANESGDVLKKCKDLDFDCERCTEKCACHSCENSSNYEWQGLSPE